MTGCLCCADPFQHCISTFHLCELAPAAGKRPAIVLFCIPSMFSSFEDASSVQLTGIRVLPSVQLSAIRREPFV